MHLFWLHAQMYVSRRTEIVRMKLILQVCQVALVRVVIEMVFATKVLNKSEDAL